MLKVVLIDDEPIIVEGLSRSVDWQKYNCEVVGTANDGMEGRTVIEAVSPDILFLDICMPEIDGLSMVAGIKSQFPNMQICILTGFRDFDYAQTAIRLGVCRFLLKPSNMEEIEEAIRAMAENLKEKQGHLPESNQGISAQKDYLGEMNNNLKKEQALIPKETEAEFNSPASSFIVKNALEYIEENYAKKLKLSDVAEKTYVSQWHLSKLLNKHMEKNFSEILNSIRIEKAKEMLENPSMRIGEIAEEVGFLDMAHFSKVFKKQVGISANCYRNTVLGIGEKKE